MITVKVALILKIQLQLQFQSELQLQLHLQSHVTVAGYFLSSAYVVSPGPTSSFFHSVSNFLCL